MRATWMPLWVWTACTAEDPTTTPGGTRGVETTPYEPCRTPGPEERYEGPTSIEEVLVVCHGGTLTIDVCAIGWTSLGLVRIGAKAVEQHELPSTLFDPHQHWDQLFLQLTTTGSYVWGGSTAWSCDDGAPDVAVLVHDPNGLPADCVTVGDPVEGTGDWDCHPP